MAAIQRKSRPKSLTKRSIASSILPKVYRQFTKNGVDHHEAIDVGMSSTNELITSAFKDLKIDVKLQSTTTDSSLENGRRDVVASNLCEERVGECCILTEGKSIHPMESQGEPSLQSPILGEESCSADCCGKNTLLKTPLSIQELSLAGRNKISSSSIDSGVYSLRGSKRSSFEQASPVDPLQSNQGARRCRTMSGKRSTPTVSVEDLTTHKRVPRLSVGEEAFSELLEAAKKLVLDAHPINESVKAGRYNDTLHLENSLQHFKRRKSEWDITGLKPQHEKVQRKKSAEPILQRIPTKSSSAESNNSRRASACIICERNKQVSENVASSILIKTTMVRTMQERRRFSEVLKVYKPGDLPFTEFVVPKICELKTRPEPPPKDVQETLKDLVDDNMPTFVRLTNWNSLYAHLVSKRLLDAYMREFMLNASVTHQEKGNKFYGEYMPSHGTWGYQRLLQCYQEECDHTGHETLANLLQGRIKSIVT